MFARFLRAIKDEAVGNLRGLQKISGQMMGIELDDGDTDGESKLKF